MSVVTNPSKYTHQPLNCRHLMYVYNIHFQKGWILPYLGTVWSLREVCNHFNRRERCCQGFFHKEHQKTVKSFKVLRSKNNTNLFNTALPTFTFGCYYETFDIINNFKNIVQVKAIYVVNTLDYRAGDLFLRNKMLLKPFSSMA